MKETIFSKGAEAILIKKDNKIVVKNRIQKSYRLKELDEKIRKSRTKKEAKILEKAKKLEINVPTIFKTDKFEIEMEFLEGERLSETLNNYEEEKQFEIIKQLGKEVSKLHENDIIHNDLTTSNIILEEKKIYIIDFGLSFISKRVEDKAVDLHLIRQALEAKHFQNYNELFKKFLEGYKNYEDYELIMERLQKVEKRGRYK